MVKKTIFKTAMLAAIFAAGQAIANSNMLNDNSPLNGAPAMQMDPRLAYEILPNGFSVAAMKNAEPPNRISMRLLVRRGSSTEKSGQEGIAHFTEHMAFNGTKNFPKGEMVEYFQRLGMAFGADTNAHTSFNETVYKIDMPENSPKMIDDGLKLLSDYAGGMLFDEGEIERERGVIIAEKKARDSARYRSFVDFFESVFKGSPYSGRMPIGLESVIKNAKRSEFVDFYKANYRPENMTLVVVGDIDEKFILKEAKKYFSNLKADESVQAAFVNAAGEQAQSAQVYSSFCDADLAESGAGVYLVSKPVFPKDCIEARIFEIRMAAISCAIDLRFNSKKTSADSNFINAYSYFSDFEKYRDFFAIEVAANVSKSPEALAEVLNMYEGIVESGFGQWEIEKAKSDILNQLESAIKAKGTRKSALLSNKLVDSFSSGEIPTSPELDFEIAKFAFKNFGAEQATRLFDNYRAQSELFIRATDAKKEFLPADFDKFYSELKAAKKFCAPLAGGELIFDEFEGSGEIVSRKTNPLGFEEIVFKNGVRANLKPTDFAKDEVAISIAFGGGKYDIPKGNPEIAKAITGFFLGGTARQSYDEINVAKSDKNINMGIALDDDCFIFKVRTNTKNLREALALAATYINSPAFRPDAINAIKKKLEEEYRLRETNPDAVISLKLEDWLYKQNHMFKFAEKGDAMKIGMEQLKEWLLPILKNSYMEISIAGDFNEAQTLQWLGKFFGSMPPRAASRPDYSEFKKLEATSEPEKTFEIESSKDARSAAIKIWQTCGRKDLKKMRAATVLAAVLNDAIRKNIREKEGKVYSPAAYNLSKQGFDSGIIYAESEVAPEFNSEVASLIEKAAAGVADSITEDEFNRARLPIVKQIEKTLRSNAYWADRAMPLIQADELRRKTAETFASGYKEITLQDVKNAAAEFLKGKKGQTVKIIPKKRD